MNMGHGSSSQTAEVCDKKQRSNNDEVNETPSIDEEPDLKKNNGDQPKIKLEHKREKDDDLSKTVREIFEMAKEKILVAIPLLEHVKQMIRDYSFKFRTDNVIMVGSVGNGLFFPEVDEDGIYCIEVDIMFERSSERLQLPLQRAEKRKDVPSVKVNPVVPNSGDDEILAKPTAYVWLKVDETSLHSWKRETAAQDEVSNKDHECDLGIRSCGASALEEKGNPANLCTKIPILENTETRHYFEVDALSGNVYLHNANMRNDVPEVRVGKTIFDETELDQTFDFNRPFRTFRTSQQTHITESGKLFNFYCLFDKVVSIKLPWPEIATPWINRVRNWPPKPVINAIVESGCHVISKKSSGEFGSNRDWKYTFSTAEQTLTLSFSEAQRLCYIFVKQVKRKYLSISSLLDGDLIMESGLTSYHLKTIMLWVSERITPKEWDADPVQGIISVLEMLLKTLKDGYCPHYFIPEINIYERIWSKETMVLFIEDAHRSKFQDQRLQPLIEKVQEILADPLKHFTKDMLTALDDNHSRAKTSKILRDNPIPGMLIQHKEKMDNFFDEMEQKMAELGIPSLRRY